MSENKPLIIAAVAIGLAIVGFLIYNFSGSEPEPQVISVPVKVPEPLPEPPPPPEPEPEPIPEPEPVPAEPAFVLPRLDNSDQLVRDGAVSLTRHEGINRWVAPSELARKFVVSVDNVANGKIARDAARVLAPEGPFLAEKVSEKEFLLDPAGYRRYDSAVDVIKSVDAKRAAEFYMLVKPLMAEAFNELGYPDKNFDEVIFQAIGRLLETPVITEPIRLTQPVVMYEFVERELEDLSPAQKQLIRMGPENTKAVQSKLSEIARELRTAMAGS